MDLKQKAIHEFKQFVAISIYLAFFFCAVTTYKMLLLNEFQRISTFTSLINALVIAKVILIGEYAHLGKKHEDKPLLLCLACLYSAFILSRKWLDDSCMEKRWSEHSTIFTSTI